MKYIFIGLGNKGEQYETTKHNIGRIILKNIAKILDFPEFEFDKSINALVSKKDLDKNSIIFLMPETFMNNSGDVLKKMKLEKKDGQKIVIIYDDLDLPFLKTKFSWNRSSGGHKGLESIIKALKTQEFYRIRVGISKTNSKGLAKKIKDEDKTIDFIMKSYKEEELKELKKISKNITEAILIFLKDGYQKSASFLNI